MNNHEIHLETIENATSQKSTEIKKQNTSKFYVFAIILAIIGMPLGVVLAGTGWGFMGWTLFFTWLTTAIFCALLIGIGMIIERLQDIKESNLAILEELKGK